MDETPSRIEKRDGRDLIGDHRKGFRFSNLAYQIYCMCKAHYIRWENGKDDISSDDIRSRSCVSRHEQVRKQIILVYKLCFEKL
jgi:hypothetical protein